MKKLFCLILAMALLLSCCAVTAVAAEERPTISYWTLFTHVAGNDSYVEKYIEDKLGINIELNTTPSTEGEAVNLMLASGDMPDCITIGRSYAYMVEENELTRSIPLAMVQEYGPHIIAEMDKDPILYAMTADPKDSDALWCLPDMYDTYSEMYPRAIFLRYDWIQELGIDLGDVNVEQLTDQLYIADKGISRDVFTEIATRFVKDDPDGNGADDTYGIIDDWSRLMTSFGLTTTTMEYEGKATQWYAHPNCKEFLKYMNSLYTEGLLHPELFTLQWGMNWEMLKNNQAGIMLSGSTHYLNSWCTGRWPYAPLNGESEAQDILMIPGVTDEKGNNVCPFYIGRGFNSGNGVFWVNADADDEKMANCIRFYDMLFTDDDPELNATLLDGEKGVDWEWDEAGTTPVALTALPMGEKGANMFNLPVQIAERWRWSTYEKDFVLGVKYFIKSEGGIWNEDLVVDYKKDLFNETQAAAISNEYGADWSQIRDKYFQAFILGEKDIDAEWDAYIAELNQAHFDEYLEELDKAPVVADVVAEYDSKY